MADWMAPYEADYTDLGFDVERHREAFRSFANLGMSAVSVRPALIARERVVHGFLGQRFSVGAAPGREGSANPDAAGTETIFESLDPALVQQVSQEVSAYFSRHFPGRFTGNPTEPDSSTVYIAFQ